jgi:hypothetical protein
MSMACNRPAVPLSEMHLSQPNNIEHHEAAAAAAIGPTQDQTCCYRTMLDAETPPAAHDTMYAELLGPGHTFEPLSR